MRKTGHTLVGITSIVHDLSQCLTHPLKASGETAGLGSVPAICQVEKKGDLSVRSLHSEAEEESPDALKVDGTHEACPGTFGELEEIGIRENHPRHPPHQWCLGANTRITETICTGSHILPFGKGTAQGAMQGVMRGDAG